MIEFLRDPTDAELNISNAIANIHEACVILRQYAPEEEDGEASRLWLHQVRKLRMAIGICSNVRDLITRDVDFASVLRRRS